MHVRTRVQTRSMSCDTRRRVSPAPYVRRTTQRCFDGTVVRRGPRETRGSKQVPPRPQSRNQRCVKISNRNRGHQDHSWFYQLQFSQDKDGYPEGFRSVVVIARVGASRDETKTQARNVCPTPVNTPRDDRRFVDLTCKAAYEYRTQNMKTELSTHTLSNLILKSVTFYYLYDYWVTPACTSPFLS